MWLSGRCLADGRAVDGDEKVHRRRVYRAHGALCASDGRTRSDHPAESISSDLEVGAKVHVITDLERANGRFHDEDQFFHQRWRRRSVYGSTKPTSSPG